MSAKWERSKAWDDQFFPAWAAPIKFLLRAFSSITLSVILLSFVLLYGVVASIPIGLLAQLPTWFVYSLTLVATVAVLVLPAALLLRRSLRSASGSVRFAAHFVVGLAMAGAGVALWLTAFWPLLRYDPAAHTGLRFFADFTQTYASTTLRRLPSIEMTEGEFYGWWPLRLVLILFIINLITATLRRIELRFMNLGVLTVHTGIIVLAFGSFHYQNLKEEGDVLLLAGAHPGQVGPPARAFMDRYRPALWVSTDGASWSIAPIPRLPRYNDFGEELSDRKLAIEMPSIPPADDLDDPVSIHVVGFGSYVEMVDSWEPAPADADLTDSGGELIELDLVSSLPSAPGELPTPRPVGTMRLPEGSPVDRVANIGGALFVEHVPEEDETRWSILDLPAPPETNYALVVWDELGEPKAVPVQAGDTFETDGYSIEVKNLHTSAPFPIITPGYKGADSSVAIVNVTTSAGDTFERWVFHRYPELDQDIHGMRDDGRPDRRPADPALKLMLLDMKVAQVYVRGGDAIVRLPGGEVTSEKLGEGHELHIGPMIAVKLTHRWANSMHADRPVVVATDRREKNAIGTFGKAAIELELSAGDHWRQTLWLPFSQYMNIETGAIRSVDLPNGRSLRFAFSRRLHGLPGISLRLADFEMIPYIMSDIPRDYVSNVVVIDAVRGRTDTFVTRLNYPLIHRAPFQKRDDRPAIANVLAAVVNVIAPNRYKFSQAGWDAQGWRESQAKVEAGELERPFASFTILGVGNNPGIHIIALGSVMVALGIPWAFYIKPMIVRSKKRRLKREHAQSVQEAKNATPPKSIDTQTSTPQPVHAGGVPS